MNKKRLAKAPALFIRMGLALCLLGLAGLMIGLAGLANHASATRIGRKPAGPLIKNAYAIAVVEIADVSVRQVKEKGVVCVETTTLTLIPKYFVKGRLPEGTRLSFSYRMLLSDRAPCPRIYEVHAPRARLRGTGARKGVELIATVERRALSNGKVFYKVTSTHDLSELQRIKRISGE